MTEMKHKMKKPKWKIPFEKCKHTDTLTLALCPKCVGDTTAQQL